jgi:dolichol-phosphate mannosyltransferase
MRSKKSHYLIIIPTYDEKRNVGLIIEKINKRVKFKCDILFVDDNSTDGTIQVLKNIKSKNVSYIIREKKLGIGSAHKFGIRKAYLLKYKYIITMDCDGTHDPKYINKMVENIQDREIVITNRFAKNDSLKQWDIHRKLITTLRHLFVTLIFKTNLDSSGAFRFYNTKKVKLKNIFLAKSDGYSFFTESTVTLNKLYKIDQIPILLPKRYSGYSKMKLTDVVFGFFYIIFLYFKNI